ncbi:ArsR family transcriptional regulator [Candidatus Nanohalovita haloferacivicina]|uniref:ArsR family transcriptional regulator n=1 Tax=Candidatus Nanohalovita haloferacivicina TaxID=2978046 RepID=UPI00325FCED1|nr:ArsR family transcriptional regulator [Candidatus Nanohalobia archaeon BNXNv]
MFEMAGVIEDGKSVNAEEITPEIIRALSDETRRKIVGEIAEGEAYPSEVAKKLELSKQKAYYHFNKLQDAGIIEKTRSEEKSGGTATYYSLKSKAYYLLLTDPEEGLPVQQTSQGTADFLSPLIVDGDLKGDIVVGSPDQHGPDQVRARDGHLAGEIGLELGKYCDTDSRNVSLDTEIFRRESFDENMILVGGVLTNTVTKKFNEHFPAHFSGEEFPYRELSTPNSTYSEASIGVVAKTQHPENPDNAVYLIAGIRNQGTEAAVRAFKNLEDITEDYSGGDYYKIVRGLDMDGDGEVDSFEVVE